MRIIKQFTRVGNNLFVEEFYYPTTFLERIKSLWEFKYTNIIPPIRLATKEESEYINSKYGVSKNE